MSGRTIAAKASSSSNSALGVIRISGDDAIATADRVFFPFSGVKLASLDGYQAAYGQIKDENEILDDAVALVFKAPHSFTGEDTVEISVHGGSLLMQSVLRLILRNGAFPAEPGEFSKRAFLNGKFDLTRAESIMGLISAKSESELRLSRAAHLGRTADKINSVIEKLTKADAAVAVYSDYPDEDIEGLDTESFSDMLYSVKNDIEIMLKDYDVGKVIRDGVETVIVGKPNVGKSTVMNMLSGTDRSIVTDIAGTTRDVIEETVTLGEVTLRLADTAGIHGTQDVIESIGVELALGRIESAQLILAVFDCTTPPDEDDILLLDRIRDRNTVVLVNKTDLGNRTDMSVFDGFEVVEISAKEKSGYDELKEAVARATGTYGMDPDSARLMNERQRFCAEKALESVNEALSALLSGCTVDAVGICIDDALSSLLELTGKRVTNEVADEIFRSFCVGK